MCGDNENVTKGFPEWFLGALKKLQKETVSFIMCLSIHLHGTVGLPLDGFS
jgi:hypothetical protein